MSPRPLPRRRVDSLPRWLVLNLAIFVAVWIIFGGLYAVVVESVGGGGSRFPLLAAELWPLVVGVSLAELALVAAWLLPGLAAYLVLVWRLRESPQYSDPFSNRYFTPLIPIFVIGIGGLIDWRPRLGAVAAASAVWSLYLAIALEAFFSFAPAGYSATSVAAVPMHKSPGFVRPRRRLTLTAPELLSKRELAPTHSRGRAVETLSVATPTMRRAPNIVTSRRSISCSGVTSQGSRRRALFARPVRA